MIGELEDLFAVVFDAATFQPTAHEALSQLVHMQRLAFLVPFLAGVSEMAGQSATLILNRVPRIRFIASLLVTGLVYVLVATIWTLLTVFLATRIEASNVSAAYMSAIIAVSFAPRVLGVLTIAPYYGEFLGRALDGWMIAVAAFGIHLAIGLSGPLAATCSISGWAIWVVLRNVADRLLGPVIRRVEAAVAGRPLTLTFENVDDVIRARIARNGNGPDD
jgi:hypothetical protein